MNDFYVYKKNRPKVDIKPSNVCHEILCNKNQTVFSKADFNLLELTFLRFFWMFLWKIEWSSCLNKIRSKKLFLPLKLALRVLSDTAHSPIFPLFYTVQKRLTSDLLNGSCLTSVRKNCIMPWVGGEELTERVSLTLWI